MSYDQSERQKHLQKLLAQPNLVGQDLMDVLRGLAEDIDQIKSTYNFHTHAQSERNDFTYGPEEPM